MGINIYPHKRIAKEQIRLKKIRIRLIGDEERDRWDDVVSKFHYLGHANLTGRQLRYVAETPSGRCLALISFGGPALQLAGRDNWIGWHPEQRLQRLHFVVQNSRFLILPWIQTTNLASRVMALCLDRLEEDWKEAFGYSPVLVETFVDRCRKGTSYRADNWIRLGETAGFSRDPQGFYKHNGSPKTLWIKPLRANAAEILRSDTLPADLEDYELSPKPERIARHIRCPSLETLFDAFDSLTDTRARKGRRHSLRTCLAVVACGILAGARGLNQCATVGESLREPQRRALRMWCPPGQKKHVPPSHSTLWRAVSRVDPEEFERVLFQWYNSQSDRLPGAVAFDGKAVRCTLDEDNVGLHVVSAVPHDDSFFLLRPRSSAKAMNTKL